MYHIGLEVLYVIGLLVIKKKVLSQTSVHHLNDEEPRDHDVQERIHDHHDFLEDLPGSKDFGTSFYGYYSFINDDEDGSANVDPNKEEYQGPTDYPEIDEIIDNSDEERVANSYDQ